MSPKSASSKRRQGNPVTSHRARLPAGGNVCAYLHDTDVPGFARMMNAILNGRPFVEAVAVGYPRDVRSLWQQFTTSSAE
jgi:hypothetical protein